MLKTIFTFLSLVIIVHSSYSKSCLVPESFENGKIVNQNINNAQYFIVQCTHGYYTEEQRFGRCISGNWSVPFPQCKKYPEPICSALKSPVHGKKICNSNVPKINSTCNFYCKRHFNLVGSPARTCQESLEWSGDEAKCEIQPNYAYDVDECQLKTHNCDQICHNTVGSYKCSCNSGYKLIDGYRCEDIDECAIEKTNPCQHRCHNTQGGFYCSCSPGYILVYGTKCEGCRRNSYRSSVDGSCEKCPLDSFTDSDGKTSIADCQCLRGFVGDPSRSIPCTDVDECATNNFGCSHKCINIPGSVFCSCPRGFELQVDNKTCVDVDECSINNGGCQGTCINEIGSFGCICQDGYTISKLNHYLCDDIDECAINNGGCSDVCVNFPGSYYCSCKNGSRLDEFQMNCIAITCPNMPTPHYSNKRCELDKEKLEQDLAAYPINTTCSFKCISGFKEEFKGKIRCKEDGNWSGEIPKCIGQTCPALSAPENGAILPTSCTRESRIVKEKCTYTCNQGYVLKASKPVVRCRHNLTWTNTEIPKCIPVKIKPFILCPNDITVDLLSQENSQNITIPEPDTNSEYEIIPRWVSIGQPTIFPAGRTDITLKIKNSKIRCSVTVQVLDKEPPVFQLCPNSIEIKDASAFGEHVLWEDPIVVDNVGVHSLHKSLEPNTMLNPGVHTVEYMAEDAAGNTATCSFEITVTSTKCADLEDPLHGEANCMDWIFGQICTPSCKEGFMRDPDDSEYYFCNDLGVWNPSSIVSECLEYYTPVKLPCKLGFKLFENTTDATCVKCPKSKDSSENETC